MEHAGGCEGQLIRTVQTRQKRSENTSCRSYYHLVLLRWLLLGKEETVPLLLQLEKFWCVLVLSQYSCSCLLPTRQTEWKPGHCIWRRKTHQNLYNSHTPGNSLHFFGNQKIKVDFVTVKLFFLLLKM